MFLNFSVFNFGGALQAFASMWRCLTGEDWYQIMWDVAVSVILSYYHHVIYYFMYS